LRLKSYFAATVEAAMGQAREDLGDDAMLLDSRPAAAGARHLGAYEVVFALPEKHREEPRLKNDTAPLAAAPSSRVQSELTQLRREMEKMKQTVTLSGFRGWAGRDLYQDPDLARASSLLLAADVAPAIVEQLLVDCARQPIPDRAGRVQPANLELALREQMARLIRVAPAPHPGSPDATTRAVALLGPPGAGKTTTLAKLAATYGLRGRRPMFIISLDTLRVAATTALRTYAAILGCGFQIAESPRALAQLFEEHRSKQWIWIDTPGLGPRDMDAFSDWTGLFRSHTDIDVHLVLSAAMKSADLQTAVERYECFEPDKVLFTHLDETDSYGSLYSAAAHSGKPISFLSTGQQVPEDLEPATLDRVLDLVLQPGWAMKEAGVPAQAGHAVAGS